MQKWNERTSTQVCETEQTNFAFSGGENQNISITYQDWHLLLVYSLLLGYLAAETHEANYSRN